MRLRMILKMLFSKKFMFITDIHSEKVVITNYGPTEIARSGNAIYLIK